VFVFFSQKGAMRTLYYYHLCAASRTAMFVLSEKRIDFSVEITRFWEQKSKLCELNPFGRLPVLVDLNGSIVSGVYAVSEYLEETYEENRILSTNANERAEARRIFQWVNEDLSAEITSVLAFEKGIKRYFASQDQFSTPSSSIIKQIKKDADRYFKQIETLIEKRRWLAGSCFSIADIAAAASISIIDYFGNISWEQYPTLKEWYARIKSRPSFRRILNDRVPGISPISYYNDPDF
jgi:glutathione S-transferase